MPNVRWIKELHFKVGDREGNGDFDKLCLEISSWVAHNGIEGLEVNVWSLDMKLHLCEIKQGRGLRIKTSYDDRWLGMINKAKLEAIVEILKGDGPDVVIPEDLKLS